MKSVLNWLLGFLAFAIRRVNLERRTTIPVFYRFLSRVESCDEVVKFNRGRTKENFYSWECSTFTVAFAIFNTCIPCCELTSLVGFFGLWGFFCFAFFLSINTKVYGFPMVVSKFTVT